MHAPAGAGRASMTPWGSVFVGALFGLSCGSGSVRMTPRYVAVHNTMTAMGLAQSGPIVQGTLAEGAASRSTLPLSAGDCYAFVAFGEDGVADVDLLLIDDAGTEVAADRTHDAQAALQYCPEVAGRYQVVVRMAAGSGKYLVTSWSGGAQRTQSARANAAPSERMAGTCAQPIPLTLGQPVEGNTSGGTSALSGSCVRNSSAPERVYSFELAHRAQVSFTMESQFDGALYLYSSCGESRSEITCNDDAPDTSHSRVQATLDAGRYFLVVDGYGSASGAYRLTGEVTQLESLARVCAAASALTPGRQVTASTHGQPNYFQASCASGAASPDQVYSLELQSRSRVRVSMESGGFDGALHMRSDCVNPSSELACNDDHSDTHHSMVSAMLDPGRYFVFADGFGSNNQGDFILRADVAPVAGGGAPADSCPTAGVLTPGQSSEVDTFAAADDLAGSCGGRGAPDAVYALRVTSRTQLRAKIRNPSFQSVLYLQSRCGQASTEQACAVLDRPDQELVAALSPGNYFLVVDGKNESGFGSGELVLEMDDLRELDRVCRRAPRLTPGRVVRGDTSSSRSRFQATCAGRARSNEMVYRVVLPRRSRVRITAEQEYDGALYLRSDCADAATEVACNDDSDDNRHSTLEATLDRGTYYLFVDGFGAQSNGAFTLQMEITRP